MEEIKNKDFESEKSMEVFTDELSDFLSKHDIEDYLLGLPVEDSSNDHSSFRVISNFTDADLMIFLFGLIASKDEKFFVNFLDTLTKFIMGNKYSLMNAIDKYIGKNGLSVFDDSKLNSEEKLLRDLTKEVKL